MPRTSVFAPLRRASAWRALATAVPTVALVVSLAAPPALADVSTTPIQSWGTARSSGATKPQRVNAVVEANGVAYLGGAFNTMVSPGGATAARSRLAAIDGTTGDLTAWNPRADGAIYGMALAADGQSVYVGGDFSHIGGRSARKLAKINLATGLLDTSFKPVVSSRVRGLALDGQTLYIGGNFTSVGGQPRPKLAAVDAVSGAVLGWTPPPLGSGKYVGHTGIPTPEESPGNVYAVAVTGGKVFAAGNFLDLGGQGGLVSLDAATGALSDPQFAPGRPMFALATSGGRLFAAGGGPGGRAFGYDPTQAKPVWVAKVDGDSVGIAASATTVYVAGHYDYIVSKDSDCYQKCPGGPTRHHLSAYNASDGLPTAWNPAADTSTGPETIAVGANALYVGGEFNKINGQPHPGFAIFPGTP